MLVSLHVVTVFIPLHTGVHLQCLLDGDAIVGAADQGWEIGRELVVNAVDEAVLDVEKSTPGVLGTSGQRSAGKQQEKRGCAVNTSYP